MRGAADPLGKAGIPILALLWGGCCRAGHQVQKLNTGWKEASGTCDSSRWVRGSHACLGSSWRLWKKGGFFGILCLRLAFPHDCYRQAVLRCLSTRCLCEWLALCCGVKPLLGQALFSGRGSSLAFAVLVCGVLLSWSDPLHFSTNCSSSSGCTPLFICLFILTWKPRIASVLKH